MQFSQLQRREFITTLLSGAAAVWPLAASAQQTEQMRRVGVLMMSGQDGADQQSVMRIAQRMTDFGWIEGRNIRIDVRWSEGDLEKARAHAKALAESSDVIVTQGAIATRIAREQTGTIPIVFWLVLDPVGLGFTQFDV
jgi:putative ABC transport system substrate-binding protein